MAESDGKPPARDRLLEAFREVWAASTYRLPWPPDMQRRVDDVLELMISRGSVMDTAERLSDAEAKRATELIRRFAGEAERLAGSCPG
ncbi:MAG TPA: hypothetical protein VF170_17760, partial [Planctomycetaceae bacterium]